MQFQISTKEKYFFSNNGLELLSLTEEKKAVVKNKYIGNFLPVLVEKLEVQDNGMSSIWVKIKVIFSNGSEREPFDIPLGSLGKVNWFEEIDARCILNPEMTKAKEHIANVIRLQYAQDNIPVQTVTVVDSLGGHKIGINFIFHKGDGLIWPSNTTGEEKNCVIFKPVDGKRLVSDASYSEAYVDRLMNKIVKVCPEAGDIILALNIMWLQCSAFEEAGITPKCSVFVHGPSGVKKTTYTSFVTQLFNRDMPLERPERFNASVPAVLELMKGVRHGTLLLDDLYPANNPEMCRHQEKTLLEILRIVADGIEPARVKGGKVLKHPPKCGLLLTGEYYIGAGSDAARLIPVEINNPINSAELMKCQSDPLALSTFYNFYLQWYVDNYSKIVERLKHLKEVYLKEREAGTIHARIREMQFCLEATFRLYLLYRYEKGFISEEEMTTEYMVFYSKLNSIVEIQNMRAQKRDTANQAIDYFTLIKKMMCNSEFKIAKNPYNFDKKVHDGVVHKKYIYFRKEQLLKKICQHYKEALFEDVLDCLEMKQVLKKGSKSKTVQLFGTGGLRFYAIRRDALASHFKKQ